MPRGIISGGTREFKYDRDLANYITHVSLKISPDGGYPPAKCIESMEVYDKMFIERFPDDYFDDPIYMLGYASVNAACMLLNAIEISNSFDEAKLTHTIRTEVFKSLIGEIRYDSRNGNLNEGVAVQIVGNRDNIFSPAIFSNASLIYPAPTWDERVEVSKYHATEIAINIIAPIFILNSLGWAIYIIIFRKERKIIASSPIFLICMLIGSILIYISLFLWMPNNVSKGTCITRVALLSFGFMFLFGSMVVKTWRVHLLFSQQTLKIFSIPNRKVALFLGILLSVDVILFILWATVSTTDAVPVVVDEYRPSKNYYKCSTTNTNIALVWTIVGYHILLFIYGAYLALRVRTIPIKIYDESKIIAFCIYNVGLVAIIVCILEGAGASSDRYIQFLIRSILIILSTAITINTMFAGKARYVSRLSSSSNDGSNSYNKNESQEKMNSISSSANNDQSSIIKMLKKKNRKLKNRIKELEKVLTEIDTKVDVSKVED